MANFDLSGLALESVCPGNELLYDDTGKPSVMVRIPKLTLAQLGMGDSNAVHPAFIVNGQEIDAIWISKYQNIVYNGRAYSLPAQCPQRNINYTNSLAACTAKGRGWHLMTCMEWGLLMRWCESNGFIPRGNNYYGRDYDDTVYKAIPMTYDSSNRINLVATGTGPLTWSHNGEPDGIFDLKGNQFEWTGGLRLVYGELQMMANNNAADPENSESSTSAEWKAINAATGSLVTPDGNGTTSGTVKMDYANSRLVYSTTLTNQQDAEVSVRYSYVTCDDTIGDNAKLLLQELGALPYSDSDLLLEGGADRNRFYFNNAGEEYMFSRGGRWNFASLGFGTLCYSRRSTTYFRGFRAAFCELPSA